MSKCETVSHVTENYPISVDYGMSVEDAVKSGRYDWTHSDINSRNFPTTRAGKSDLVIKLIHFGRDISSGDVLRELDKLGFRPAELHDLLAFGEKYPDFQREFPVVALGSVWPSPGGNRSVPCLHRRGSERYLHLRWFGLGWGGVCRFAAVRK